MPRIDPEQLLNCLQVLLTPSGGILSKNEVQRLANLMTKFSKKLVSKCIYILILKNTENQLLGQFMAEGGWNLIHLWLQDAHINKNWSLVAEVLELLLITPVDVERLKMNNLPKLVKSLTKRDDLPGIQQLSTSLVELWLTIVKDVTKQEQMMNQQVSPMMNNTDSVMETSPQCYDADDAMDIDETISRESNIIVSENGIDSVMQTITEDTSKETEEIIQTTETTDSVSEISSSNKFADSEETDKENSDKDKKQKSVPKKSSSSSNSSSSSSKSSSSSSSKDKDRDKSKDRSKSSNSSSRSSSSKSSSRDKDRKDRDKDRHRHNGSSSASSSKHRSSSSKSSSSKESSKDSKEKQAEKDKDTLAKIQPQGLQKVGRIPKKTDDSKKDEKKESKKSSFSVEVRKGTEEKPKTVKVYNSKLRSTGLLEEAKPPLPRSATKKTAPPPVIPANITTKRSSPIRDMIPPPEKKSRLMEPEKGIKLIPPKPKPAMLQESDIFMDALAASATAKKEPKKRKRRASVSKDSSPPTSPSSKTPASPTTLKNITPANFYQDTLETKENDENKESENDSDSKNEANEDKKDETEEEKVPDTPTEPDEDSTEVETTRTDANGLKGVLSYAKRKGPKRSIRWRPDADLVEVQYFELDETERVNVMKPFMDMQRMEMTSEREALRQRKLPNEDTMESQIPWRPLVEIEAPPFSTELGSKSLEKDIQLAREKRVLQAIYFNNRIPDTPNEPDVEIVPPPSSVIMIPLTDADHPEQEAVVHAWPEPKGSPPHVPNTPPSLFSNVPAQFIPVAPNFTPHGLPQFTPPFVPPSLITRPPGDWNIISNGIPPNIPPPELMQQVPPLFDNFGAPQGPPAHFPNAPNPMPQMFPPNQFNNNMRGRGGFRRGGPNVPWMRMGAPNQGGWNNNTQNRGRGFCNSFKQKGFCRNRDNCPYIH